VSEEDEAVERLGTGGAMKRRSLENSIEEIIQCTYYSAHYIVEPTIYTVLIDLFEFVDWSGDCKYLPLEEFREQLLGLGLSDISPEKIDRHDPYVPTSVWLHSGEKLCMTNSQFIVYDDYGADRKNPEVNQPAYIVRYRGIQLISPQTQTDKLFGFIKYFNEHPTFLERTLLRVKLEWRRHRAEVDAHLMAALETRG